MLVILSMLDKISSAYFVDYPSIFGEINQGICDEEISKVISFTANYKASWT
jgi:hypothetical protein